MANLNSTMTLNAATNLIGKNVSVSDQDTLGNCYNGKVNSVTKNGDTITLGVSIADNGITTTKKFDYSHVISVNPDTTTSSS